MYVISHEKVLKLLTNKKKWLKYVLINLYETHFQVKNVTIYITKIFLWPLFLNISAKAFNAQQLHTSIKYLLGNTYLLSIILMITCIFPTYLGRYSYGNAGTHLWVWLIFWLLHISFLQRATFFFVQDHWTKENMKFLRISFSNCLKKPLRIFYNNTNITVMLKHKGWATQK